MSASYVQSVQATGSGVTSLTTGSLATTTGNTVCLAFSGDNSVTGMADNKTGNTYSLIKRQFVNPGGGELDILTYGMIGITGGAGHTWTMSASAGQFCTFQAIELASVSAVDAGSVAGSSTGTSPYTLSSAGQAQADNVLLLFGGTYGGGTSVFAESTGYTKIRENTDNNNFCTLVSYWKSINTTSAVASSQTDSGATGVVAFNRIVIAFKSTSAPSLTAVTGTGSVGTVIPSTAKALTGNTGTGSTGTVAASSAKAITGISGTGSVGTVGPNVTVALTAVSATGTAGTVTPSTGIFVALSGVTGTGSTGSVAPVLDKPLTGVSGIGSSGTVGPSADKALSGNSATGSVGAVSPASVAVVTGTSGTASVGSIGPSTTVGLLGASGTGSVGTVTPVAGGTIVPLTGVSGASSVGQPGVDIVVALSGVTGTGIAGNVSLPSSASGGDAWGREKKRRRAQVQAEVNARNLEIIKAELAQEAVEIVEVEAYDDDEEVLMLML